MLSLCVLSILSYFWLTSTNTFHCVSFKKPFLCKIILYRKITRPGFPLDLKTFRQAWVSVCHVKCIFCAVLGCGQEPSLFMWWGLLEKVISRHNVVNVSFIPCTTLVVQRGFSTNVISPNPDSTNAVFTFDANKFEVAGVSVVIWFASWPPVRESRVRIRLPH